MTFIVGKIAAEIGAEDAEFHRTMRKVHRSGQQTADAISRTFKKAAFGAAAVATAFAGASFKFTQIASDAEETQSKFNVVFRGMDRQANRWAESFADDVGRARQDIKEWTASVADTLKPMGVATDEAAKMSQEMIKLALDVASFNNKQDPEVIGAFTAALTGERERLKSLGIAIREADVEQEAYRLGLVRTGQELTQTAKAQATLSLLYKQTADAQGDLERTSDSFANQQKRLQGQLKNMGKWIGDNLLPIYTQLIEKTNDWLKENEDLIKLKIDKWVGKIADGIQTIADIAVDHGDLIGKVLVAATITTVVGKLTALATALNPVTAAIAGLTAVLTTAYALAVKQADRMQEKFNAQLDQTSKKGKLTVEQMEKLQQIFKEKGVEGAKEFLQTLGISMDALGTGMQITIAGLEDANDAAENTADTLEDVPEKFKPIISEADLLKKLLGEIAYRIETISSVSVPGWQASWSVAIDEMKLIGMGLGSTFSRSMSGAFIQILSHAKKAGDILHSTWHSTIQRIASTVLANAAIFSLARLFTADVGSAALLATGGRSGSIFGALFGGFRATGGPVSAGKSYVVGERGPEVFSPRMSGHIMPSMDLPSVQLNRRDIRIHITGNLQGDGEQLHAVINHVQRVQAGY